MTKAQSVAEQEAKLLAVMSGQRFLNMEGLTHEIPFFIYPYDPLKALEVAGAKKRLATNLGLRGVVVIEINLYELTIEILQARGAWDAVLAIEPEMDKADFHEFLQGPLDPEAHIAPAVRAKLAGTDYDVLFLTGVGEVFPYIRSHNVLNNLMSVCKGKPMVVFFPGDYEQSDTLGSALVLFGKLKDDQYYRAKNILKQGA